MAATNIGSSKYPLAKIPAMADPADIQVALKYYHWGQEAEPEGTATAGISKYLDDIDTRIDGIDSTLANVVEETIIDAKGDLLVGTSNNNLDNLKLLNVKELLFDKYINILREPKVKKISKSVKANKITNIETVNDNKNIIGECDEIISTDKEKMKKSDKNIEPSKNAQFVLDVIAKESEILNTKPNAWIVYNAMNEWIYSDERNKKNDDMRRNLDIKVFNKVEQMFL